MANVGLEAALKVCDAAIARAQEIGITIGVSVVDSGTNLVAFQKMDGTRVLAIEGSRGKAVASAIFGQASSELEPMADRPVFRALMVQMGGRLIMGPGAVPLMRDGEVIGACGVGGGTGEEDEACARAGAAAKSGG